MNLFIFLGAGLLSIFIPDKVKVISGLQEDEYIEHLESLSSQIPLINLSNETALMNKARESIKYFIKLYSLRLTQFKKLHLDWEEIAGYINQLSRIFQIRGYFSESDNAVDLLFKVAEFSENNVALIQSFSSLLQASFTKPSKFEDVIAKTIMKIHDILYDTFINLEILKSPRTENTVLICLLNLAFYYYLKSEKDMAFSLLEMVRDAIDFKLPSQIGKFNVIRMYLHLIEYRILVKEENFSLEGASSLHKVVEEIFNCFKSQVYISSEDSILYPIVQFEAINDLFIYHSLRFTTNKMGPYVRSLLSHGLSNGCALRTIQTASIYSYIHYQSECMTKFLVSF